jgi:hypothetical protein
LNAPLVAVGPGLATDEEVGVADGEALGVPVGTGELTVNTDAVGVGVAARAEDWEKILKKGNNPSDNDVAIIRVLFQ